MRQGLPVLCPRCLNAARSCCLGGRGLTLPLLHFTLNIITDFEVGVERGGEGLGRKRPQQEINLKELINMPTCRHVSPELLRGGGSSRGEP